MNRSFTVIDRRCLFTFAFCVLPHGAAAGNCTENVVGSREFTCSGPASDLPGGSIDDYTNISGGGDITVRTQNGFGLNSDRIALRMNGDSARYVDGFSSDISGTIGIELIATTGALEVNTKGNVIGRQNEGMSLTSTGTDVSITSEGQIIGRGSGLSLVNDGFGNVIISTHDVTGETGDGILINAGTDSRNISTISTGTIRGGRSGIDLSNIGAGNVSIYANSVVGSLFHGIQASSTEVAGHMTIRVENAVEGVHSGLAANSLGDGDLHIDVEDVTATIGWGVLTDTSELSGTTSIRARGDITGGRNGVASVHRGRGDLIVDVQDVTGTNGTGLHATVFSGGHLVVRGEDITGIGTNANGIDVSTFDGGDIDINVTSAIGDVNGSGLRATNYTPGNMRLQVQNSIGGARGRGILVQSFAEAADISISSTGTVSGGRGGIVASKNGAGNLVIRAHNAEGGSGSGISVRTRSDQANISIVASGMVTGGRTGIATNNEADTMARIELTAGALVTASSGLAIENSDGNSQTILRDGSSVVGEIELNAGIDTLIIGQIDDFSTISGLDGGGDAQDTLIFTGLEGQVRSEQLANWDHLQIANGSQVRLVGSDLNTVNNLLVSSGSTLRIRSDVFDYNSPVEVGLDSTLSFSGSGAGRYSLENRVHNDGMLSLQNGSADDVLTLGRDIKGSGAVALDVDGANNTSDLLVIRGDSNQTRQGVFLSEIGSDAENAQVFTLVRVLGANEESDFYLAEPNFVTNDGKEAVNDGQIAFVFEHDAQSGTFVLNPFDAEGNVWMNPAGDIYATAVQDYVDHMQFRSSQQRFLGVSKASTTVPGTVSRALDRFISAQELVGWVQAEYQQGNYVYDSRFVDRHSTEIRFGAGLPFAESANGTWLGGLEFGVGQLQSKMTSALTSAKVSTDALDVTLNATWVGTNGVYWDNQLKYAIFETDFLPNGGEVTLGKASGYGLSLEFGRIYELSRNVSVIPQAQVSYVNVDADATNVVGAQQFVSATDGNNTTTRLGVRLERGFANGSLVYSQADYFHAIDGEIAVGFGQSIIQSSTGDSSATLTLGTQVNLSQTSTFYGEYAANIGIGGEQSASGHSFSFGVAMNF